MVEKNEGKKDRYVPGWKTAADVVAPHQDHVATEAKELAEEHGVIAAAYAEYAEALDMYQGRDDVETLANRRARENGVAFSENDHHRALAGKGGRGVITTEAAKSPTNTKPETEGGTEAVTAVPVNQDKGKK